MRIAYVTRAPSGEQGKLQGNYALMRYMISVLRRSCIDMCPVYVGTGFAGIGEMERFPELRDIGGYAELRDKFLGEKYDIVLYADYGFAPFFYEYSVPAVLVVHTLWVWPDDTAYVLEKFLPFVKEAIVPTRESWGLFTAKGIKAHFAPYPIDVPEGKMENRKPYVLWVGRSGGKQKRLDLLVKVAALLPNVEFVAYVSDSAMEAPPGNIRFHVGESAADAMGEAKVFISTSAYETYATAIGEAGIRGCLICGFDVIGTGHYAPFYKAVPFPDTKLLVKQIEQLLRCRRTSDQPERMTEYFRGYAKTKMVATFHKIVEGVVV